MIENKILKSFFSSEEIKQLKTNIKNDLSKRTITTDQKVEDVETLPIDKVFHIHHFLGRAMALNPDISNVLEKVTKEIKKYHPDAEYSASRYIEYSPKWGNGKPMLTMHKDSDIKEGDTTPYEVARDIKKERVICFDYQLDSNTDWPLIVENLEFGLQNNDALLMYPEKQLHGRPDKNFNNFEFVQSLLISFTYKFI